ncbi:hypothetical protein C4J83_0183 [Pseudomonas sp. LBUM920]|nr:hypothetical protein C4J83_0183 [Pseudomonas sp. LBUM920]
MGCEAALKPGAAVCWEKCSGFYWGCFAAQRGASPLATASPPARANLAAFGQPTRTSGL